MQQMRKEILQNNEHYHIFNRGVDKRDIFMDEEDIYRFFQSMDEFNTTEPIGSLYENAFYKDTPLKTANKKLVNFISYCLNPNHFHFVLEQIAENGISYFMKRLCGGYVWYFNNKYKRNGSLFQGKFKAKHINTNDYLLHVATYVNLNDQVHQLGDSVAKFKIKSSWEVYMKVKTNFCKKDIVLNQFKTTKDYEVFAKDALELMLEKKKADKEISSLLFE